MSTTEHLKQSRRELVTILCTWAAFCVWVIGYCSLYAYPGPEAELSTSFGMPSWVFWGIAVPWCCATLFTIYFGFGIFRDQPLDDEEEDAGR